MYSFEYQSTPERVIFGPGCVKKLPDEIRRLNKAKPLLLSTPDQLEQVRQVQIILQESEIVVAGIFSKAVMHTPANITLEAISYTEYAQADCLISFGGGSTIGLGKAISIRTGLEHICIPTTYSGSEMTSILGETAEGRKTTWTDRKILPGTVMYDVDFTLTLPVGLSATSGVNAIAHAVEALYGHNKNPLLDLMAIEGIRTLAKSLLVIINNPQDSAARSEAQYGAWLCGRCLGSVGMALHHKLCHTLGGTFNLPHAETHTIVLPHAIAYNAPQIPEVMERLAKVLPGSDGDAVRGLNLLVERLKVKRALQDFGMREEQIDEAADIAMSNQYANPRTLDRGVLREVIRRCWAGEEARADL